MLTLKGRNNENGSFNWQDALADAGIMGGLTFFTALGGLGTTGALGGREFLAAAIAGAIQFFTILAIKRGLREKTE